MGEMAYDEIDLSSLDFWAQPASVRAESFRELRRERPVSYHRPVEFGFATIMPSPYDGLWMIATHELVRAVSREAESFCSGEGVLLDDGGMPAEMRESIASFLVMDGRRHATLRRLVSKAFTPRNVAVIEEQIADQAKRIVDRLLEVGDCDFVEEVSTPLPLWTISEMLGVPEADRNRIVVAANTAVATSDPEFAAQGETAFATMFEAVQILWACATSMAEDRRKHPGDDLMSALVQVSVDGEQLTDDEIGAFMVLLSIAGNDTTRNTISHTARALADFPDQREGIRQDVAGTMPTAVEEFVRWATPVICFRRTTTRDVVVGGQLIPEGEAVVLLYESANRDSSVFEEPDSFDVLRSPNDHVGFGGGGPHFCMGAQLARTQLRCVFSELIQRVPDLSIGPPEYLASNLIHGIKRMQCQVGRR